MRKSVYALAAMCILLCPVSAHAEGVRFGIGIGVVGNVADVDGGDEIEGNGLYVTFNGHLDNGFLFRVSVSASEDDEDSIVEDTFLRTDLSVGYLWRRDKGFRPFVHGGVAILNVQEEEPITGIDIIDDDSTVLTFGGGFVAGNDHHGFYLDANWDPGHEVDINFNLGTSEFDFTEVHMGYFYRF